jgi:ATP-dependent Clp protease ATP-binding subunit ClpC
VFERFTDQARRIVQQAQAEARRLDFPYVGTEHELLAIALETDGLVAAVLGALLIGPDEIRGQVEQTIGHGTGATHGHIPFTPQAKKVLELSLREALQLGHSYIGAEHVLLGLIREGDGVAARVLAPMGATLNQARELVRQLPDDPSGSFTLYHSLTTAASDGTFGPIVGRHREIQAAVALLDRESTANPLLVGEPGVGVTTVAHGVAQAIVRAPAAPALAGRQVHELNVPFFAGRGPFRPEALSQSLRSVCGSGEVVVVVEHARSPVRTPQHAAVPVVDLLRPMLMSGQIRAIATSNPAEQREWSAADEELYGLFEPVVIEELTEAMSAQALAELRDRYEARHRVAITDAAITAAVTLSAQHIADKPLPGKALGLLDRAAAMAANRIVPANRGNLTGLLAKVRRDKDDALDARDFVAATACREEERALLAREAAWKAEWKNTPAHRIVSVTAEDVARALTAGNADV